jgi:four helix bundle protein
VQDYRKLLVWARAHELALAIRRAVRRHFPRRGYAKLIDQLTRAAESVAENIVEGCGAATSKEFARFLDMAIKSANETEYELLLSRDCGVLPGREWRTLTEETTEIRKMTYGLRRRVNERSREDAQQRKRTKRPHTATDDSLADD